MNESICTANTICKPSEDIVVREIEGELVIVPLAAGTGDVEDEPYTLNETGKAMWNRLDGKKSLAEVAAELAVEFEALARELLKRKILAEVSSGGA
jgi:hypothetical protein